MTHVLAIDDDPSIREVVTKYLGDSEIRVTALESGRGVAEALSRHSIDLLILDLRLPGEDGMQIARRVREISRVPILMLSARTDEEDRVMAFEIGADDYVTKPFSPRELLARVRALVRRSRAYASGADELPRVRAYRFAGCEFSVRLRRLLKPDGEAIALTNTQFNLLAAFLASPQCVLSRDELLQRSRLHGDEVFDRAIDVQVARLRRRIQPKDSAAELIRTERGAGYVFTARVEIVR
jgi:two-component system, OmpR family, response regulator